MIALFFFLTITFWLLAGGKNHSSLPSQSGVLLYVFPFTGAFTGHVQVTKAGGYFGVITALIAYYVGTAELLVREESWFTLPLAQMPKRLD